MQSLKKYCLFVLLAVASTAQGQSFRDIEELKEMRKDLQTEDSLMRLGILKDETTGLPYFTGYSYNVLSRTITALATTFRAKSSPLLLD